jgi:hypothetical protein
VEGVLSGLVAVEARLGTKSWVAALMTGSPTADLQTERLREILDRDRALVMAGPPRHSERSEQAPAPAEAAVPTPATLPTAAALPACDEPIRTRTMARLLAAQGHRARALSIYEDLIARGDADPGLRAEAALLRSQAG